MTYTLADIANKLNAKLVVPAALDASSEAAVNITSLATLAKATTGQVAFLANSKYIPQLNDTKASAVIVSPNAAKSCPVSALVMDNPYMGYAILANLLDTTPKPASGIHPSAVIAENVVIGENVNIGANAVIESGVHLANNVSIGAGCFIGHDVTIGEATSLWANITVYHNVVIGHHCLIQANTVIGADGFGYAPVAGQYKWHKIPQLGGVVIGNHVEIGASTTIDRGALDNTEIKDGVILDNQIQIAHNAIIGENTAIAGCSVVAGSAVIGKNCTIAGLVAINGHISIADNTVFTGMSMVTKTITQAGVYSSGMPVAPNKEWHKTNARIKRLDSLTARVKALEKITR
ncbi:UDP-3-O-(3-hydroxymyristoyl)glucosamine N-acyltransferase [Colwellia ponticola]|uniref:UDP-3-O-acylglucosamine N-acyltransferase n=1 Tax=Colwellia ponticola TaxID=2304625 RepID=A0A8H2JML2_9GAMM|nr:UDP-3-O-(3-hydroxymyristoyl)glucosamine N-acyltransferase [Colwellia ponticola]TMM44889.1 UDP-3-O-(3-hydroxymyristoyl)glucosamine N-acyltransferase [Colwellia ponticola]